MGYGGGARAGCRRMRLVKERSGSDSLLPAERHRHHDHAGPGGQAQAKGSPPGKAPRGCAQDRHAHDDHDHPLLAAPDHDHPLDAAPDHDHPLDAAPDHYAYDDDHQDESDVVHSAGSEQGRHGLRQHGRPERRGRLPLAAGGSSARTRIEDRLAETRSGVSTNRLEGFSDGVLAVAITLLVLNIQVPPVGGNLADKLGRNWPSYAAYVNSFLTIGIIWINHHVMVGRLRIADHAILMLNLLLLMTIAVIPFATSLLATYLKQGHGQTLAAAIYGGVLLSMALAFVVLNWHILFRKEHMLREPLSEARRRQILSRGARGLVPYIAATALAVVSPYITLGICLSLAAYYALPIGGGG